MLDSGAALKKCFCPIVFVRSIVSPIIHRAHVEFPRLNVSPHQQRHAGVNLRSAPSCYMSVTPVRTDPGLHYSQEVYTVVTMRHNGEHKWTASTRQGDTVLPHSNREQWAAVCATAPRRAGVKQHASVSSQRPTDFGSQIEIKSSYSFSHSHCRHVRGALTRTIARVYAWLHRKIKLKNQSVQLISNMQL